MRVKSKLNALFVMLLMMILPFTNSTKSIDVNFDMKKNEYVPMTEYYQYDGFLDQVILDPLMETSDIKVELYGKTDSDYGNLNFDCTLYMDDLTFYTRYQYGGRSYYEVIQGYANKNGGVGAELEYYNSESLQNETYNIDDYKNMYELEKFVYQVDEEEENDEIDDEISLCSLIGFTLGSIIGLVVVYVVVAETAEQIKSEENYVHNRALELCDDGVYYGNMITKQSEEGRDGYCSGYYQLGFSTFEEVGCEVVSVYNLLIKLGMTEYLSDVIYEFEKWMIEFSVGWGYLGSNPREIRNFLYVKGISYKMKRATKLSQIIPNYDYKKYKKMITDNESSDNFIISFWIDPFTEGIHTYYFERSHDTEYKFKAYNNEPIDTVQKIENVDDLLADGEKFIVGYVIL